MYSERTGKGRFGNLPKRSGAYVWKDGSWQQNKLTAEQWMKDNPNLYYDKDRNRLWAPSKELKSTGIPMVWDRRLGWVPNQKFIRKQKAIYDRQVAEYKRKVSKAVSQLKTYETKIQNIPTKIRLKRSQFGTGRGGGRVVTRGRAYKPRAIQVRISQRKAESQKATRLKALRSDIGRLQSKL
jgi:hypothetical protein